MKLLLDSVILIDHFNNVTQASEYIAKHQADISLSVITRAEVLTGFHTKQHLHLAKQLLDNFKLLPLTVIEADLAASLRQTYHWKLPDAFQAAFAKHHRLKLVTRNTKDFNPAIHDFVKVPYVTPFSTYALTKNSN